MSARTFVVLATLTLFGWVDAIRFAAEAYLGDFTLGIEETWTSLHDEDLRATTIAASWYPLESLKTVFKDGAGSSFVNNNVRIRGQC